MPPADLPKAAVQLRFAQKDNVDDLRRIVYYSQKVMLGRFVMVEFPRQLLHGFQPILKRLQNLMSTDLAFTRYYAPRSVSEGDLDVLPPSYAMRPSSDLDLYSIAKPDVNGTPPCVPLSPLLAEKDTFLELIKQFTTLDSGQAAAFVEAMTKEIAFVQGPPGTGKTFLGSSLARAILAIRGLSPKPILTVCTTNHALDSFLGDLYERGVTKIVRIGNGSKEEWIKKFNIKKLSNPTKGGTFLEQHKRTMEYSRLKSM